MKMPPRYIILLCAALLLSGCAEFLNEAAGGNGNGQEPVEVEVIVYSRIRTTPLPAGAADSLCPAGGLLVETGLDLDGSGTLDDAEVESAETICNGETGGQGEQGEQGGQGETGADGAGGAAGTDGADGADGTDNRITSAYLCGGDEGRAWRYSVYILNSGDLIVQGSIVYNNSETSKTLYYAAADPLAATAPVVFVDDLYLDRTDDGTWTLEMDRVAMVVTITYDDPDRNPDFQSVWEYDGSYCTVESY